MSLFSATEHWNFFGRAYQWCADRGIYSPWIFTKDRRPHSAELGLLQACILSHI